MPRTSRRDELLGVALEAFQGRGYDGTSVADIVDVLGMTKAAFGYHLDSKEQLLIELVTPLLDDLDAALNRFPRHPSWPEEGERLLSTYLDVLIRHRDLVVWIDGDKAVLGHPIVGRRLAASDRRVREAIRGDNRSAAARLGASAVLGAMWRPLRNLTDLDAEREKEAMLTIAMTVAGTVRAS
jgi:AcrR family transcriptional regulator